ncbi:MAG TPA: mannosyltransferase family protein [Streptosporangiaceae bacterium]|nr:mannosyltransferase family protein [Streptosporangiaceae bacterium]
MLQNEAGASAVPVPPGTADPVAVTDAVPAGAVPAGAVPAGAVPAGAGRAWLQALSADDRAALGLWAAAHLALLALAWASAWAFRPTDAHAPLTGAFEHWDAILLHNIAQYGYFGPHTVANNTAFFPGYPVALAAGHLVLRNWVLSELVVSGVAGCFAMVALARLAGGSRVPGSRAVLYLLTTPAAIFLMVGYAEALFLALAIPAWHAAARGHWWRAALLAGLAGLVRPDALFLIPALAIMALTGYRGPGAWPTAAATVAGRLANAAKACCALAGPAAYELYLWVHTGNVLAWSAALRKGWDLHLSTPFQDLRTTWWAAFRHAFSASTAFEFQLEFGAIAVIAAATLAFACWRRWPQAAFCGLALIALGTSTWVETAPRTLLVLFPVWIGLAALEASRPWLRYAYFGVSAPLAVVLAMLFLSGQWAG